MTEIVLNKTTNLPDELLQELDELKRDTVSFIQGSESDNTIRSYASDWNHFTEWCAKFQRELLPASEETVALYVTQMAKDGYKVSTIMRHIAGINHKHAHHRLPRPQGPGLDRTLRGIKKRYGTAQHGKKPTLTEDIRRMLAVQPNDLLGLRNRTLILIGFSGGFRRSELVSLDREDIQFTRDGLEILLRRSKTDQEGQGRKVGIPYGTRLETCPVRNLEDWLKKSGIEKGPIFRRFNRNREVLPYRLSPQSVALIIKEAAANAGLNPEHFAGHSLRAGLATQATKGGASEAAVMNQTGHKGLQMVRRYIRDGNLFRDNAATYLGL